MPTSGCLLASQGGVRNDLSEEDDFILALLLPARSLHVLQVPAPLAPSGVTSKENYEVLRILGFNRYAFSEAVSHQPSSNAFSLVLELFFPRVCREK